MKMKYILLILAIVVCVTVDSINSFHKDYIAISNKINAVYKDTITPFNVRLEIIYGAREAHNNFISIFPRNVYSYILGIKPMEYIGPNTLEALSKAATAPPSFIR